MYDKLKDETHLEYEIQMLTACFTELQCFRIVDNRQFYWNVLCECFDVHANNLIEYYLNMVQEWNKDHYKFIDQYTSKVRTQILTLTNSRTSDNDKKIQFEDRKKIYELLQLVM